MDTGLGFEQGTSFRFSSSTVRQVVDHLADVVLADGIPGSPAHATKLDRGADPVPEHRGLVDDLLQDLYGN